MILKTNTVFITEQNNKTIILILMVTMVTGCLLDSSRLVRSPSLVPQTRYPKACTL